MPEYSFSQQVERLLALGLPELFGLGARQFQARIDSLAAHVPLARLAGAGQFRFLLVLQGKCLPVRELLSRVDRRGHRAIERLHPLTAERHRTPLTIEEGLTALIHDPEYLQPNHCFMLLGSRAGDKRVPAVWLSGPTPRLGWCWEGNPHSWLGFASCAYRSPGVMLA